MWTPRVELFSNGHGVRGEFTAGDRPIPYAQVLDLWRGRPAFRSAFNALLAESPFVAFRWETPPVTASTMDRPFEFVLLDSPELEATPNRLAFQEHFDRALGDPVAVFANTGGDATLVVPCPGAEPEAYAHLAAFARRAPEAQRDALWQAVGVAMARRIGTRPAWLSTAGGGVAWLHVRIDDRPKYYGHGPYRSLRV